MRGGDQATVDRAAQTAIECAERLEDPGVWAFLFARLEDCVSSGISIPLPLVRGISAALQRHGINLKRPTRGRPKSVMHDEWSRTNAAMVNHYYTRCGNLEEACELASEFRRGAVSARQLRRDFRAWVKVSKSE